MKEKFRYALIGCGKVARKHMKAVIHNRELLTMVALVDTNEAAMKAFLENCSLTQDEKRQVVCYTDYQKMLEEQKPEIVAITTPSGTHAKIGLDAIHAHAHLILEKPMTLSFNEAKTLITEAEQYHVKIALGHIYRFFPFVDLIAEDIARGVYGKVLYGDVKVRWGHDQAYYDQAAWRGTWKQDGGVLMNQSVHALDLMCWLMGSSVREVTGMIAKQCHDMEAEDLGLGILHFDNDSYCTIEGTTSTDPKAPEASFYLRCTNGIIKAGILSGKPYFNIVDGSGKKRNRHYLHLLLKNAHKTTGLLSLRKLGNPHSGIVRDLCLAIREDRNPRADGQSGKNALELVLALYQSAKTKAAVTLPLSDFSTDEMTGYFK